MCSAHGKKGAICRGPGLISSGGGNKSQEFLGISPNER
jgi:hypothetical protein